MFYKSFKRIIIHFKKLVNIFVSYKLFDTNFINFEWWHPIWVSLISNSTIINYILLLLSSWRWLCQVILNALVIKINAFLILFKFTFME